MGDRNEKELVFQEKDLSFYLFTPDFFHLYDKEKEGRCEPVHRYTFMHIHHQYAYLMVVLHPVLQEK